MVGIGGCPAPARSPPLHPMTRTILSFGVATALATAALAQTPLTPPHARIPANVDSGYLHNPAAVEQVVFQHRFKFGGTGWLQLEFGENVNLPEGSYLRMTAAADDGVQRHDARTLAEWSNVSALFNGGDVTLELIAGPKTRANRVMVDVVVQGLDVAMPESICGPTDDRTRSFDPRAGRLWLGCTGWMAGETLMLTAGHCQGGTRIIEFNVPLSTSSGSIVRAAPNDQYPYTEFRDINSGVGADWGVNIVGRNSNTGLLPTEANGGQWYNLGSVPTSTSGQNIRITGYGSTSPRNNLYLVQKTHVGPLAQINGTSLCYRPDTTGGNSGSPVIHENSGDAVGIHTHGGCSSTGGCNSGTRIDRGDLQQAIRDALVTPGEFRTYGQGCVGTGQGVTVCASLNGAGGTLTNDTRDNEYAYRVTAITPMSVAGFRVYTASSTGSPITVDAGLYLDSNGLPQNNPARQGRMTVGTSPDFYEVRFAQPITIGFGQTFYISTDVSPGIYVSQLTSGGGGSAAWRRPAFGGGAFQSSGLVTTPAWQILCPDPSGNATPLIGGSGRPEIGETMTTTLASAAPNAPVVLQTGFSDTTWNGNPLPFDLGSFGAPNCSLLASPEVPTGGNTDANGATSANFTWPNDSSLVGFEAFQQWLVLDAGANGLGLAVSDGLAITVGG